MCVCKQDNSSALTLGPGFGCFVDHRLVALAATHFATPEVIEIGSPPTQITGARALLRPARQR